MNTPSAAPTHIAPISPATSRPVSPTNISPAHPVASNPGQSNLSMPTPGTSNGSVGGSLAPAAQDATGPDSNGQNTPTRAPERQSAAAILNALVTPVGAALTQGPLDAPMRGSTFHVGKLDLALACGDFTAHLFETTGFGTHIIALTVGDVSSAEPLLIRMHSECITSETLGGCDCDCVKQLNAALEKIAEEGRGVLFYLRQEGRGAGYSCKGMDRMAVAASDGAVNTFQAYEATAP